MPTIGKNNHSKFIQLWDIRKEPHNGPCHFNSIHKSQINMRNDPKICLFKKARLPRS